MPSESMQISESIDRPAAQVYDYAADPAHLPEWAPGLGRSVENVDGRWFVETPAGRAGVAFVERNEFGVLDYELTLPSGDVIYNPMRVVPYDDGCEITFSVRRFGDISDADFDRDTAAVAADLAKLREVLEARG